MFSTIQRAHNKRVALIKYCFLLLTENTRLIVFNNTFLKNSHKKVELILALFNFVLDLTLRRLSIHNSVAYVFMIKANRQKLSFKLGLDFWEGFLIRRTLY